MRGPPCYEGRIAQVATAVGDKDHDGTPFGLDTNQGFRRQKPCRTKLQYTLQFSYQKRKNLSGYNAVEFRTQDITSTVLL